jgi:hypothetical protein
VCNSACTCAPVSHCAAGKPNCCCRSCFILTIAQLPETNCSCDSSSAAVKAVVVQQVISCFASRFTKEITNQEILTGCLLELLCDASSAAAAPSTALLLTAGAMALVIHEEPHFPLKTDASWCTPVKSQLLHSMAVQKEKDLLFIVHMYLCTYTVLLSPNAQYHAVAASCKHPQGTGCLYTCLHKYVIRLLQAS